MADNKDSQLTAAGTLLITDAVRVLKDPAGTPASQTALISVLHTLLAATAKTLTNQTMDGTLNIFSNMPMPRGHISGLVMSNTGADTTNGIDIAAGACRDSTDAYDLRLASSLTKKINSPWAVGSNSGGLDTGAIANTTY